MRTFAGQTLQDFENWLYAIAANQANAYIRKTSQRKKLFVEAAGAMKVSGDESRDDFSELDWPTLYQAILKLKPQHQTIVVLRFFENMEFEQIAGILNIKEATVRVALHRLLKKLRRYLEKSLGGEA